MRCFVCGVLLISAFRTLGNACVEGGWHDAGLFFGCPASRKRNDGRRHQPFSLRTTGLVPAMTDMTTHVALPQSKMSAPNCLPGSTNQTPQLKVTSGFLLTLGASFLFLLSHLLLQLE